MKLSPEDPRLTAYVLGELDPEETATIARGIAADSTLPAEAVEIAALAHCLASELRLPAMKLEASQREAILSQAREIDGRWKIFPLSKLGEGFQSWLIPAAAAAVLVVATSIFVRMSANEAPAVADHNPPPAPVVKTPPVVRPPQVPAAPPEILPTVTQGLVKAADFPSLQLPVDAGKPGLSRISRFILSGSKPPREAVHLEDLINTFSYRFNGVTAIARQSGSSWHPDTREDGMSRHVATLSSELIACPWKPSATLLFISLRGNALNSSEIHLTYHSNLENVSRYRLLGYLAVPNSNLSPVPTQLAANATTTLVLEIDPSKSDGDLGSIEWSANGEKAPTLSLVYRRAAEPSDDARFAALVCTYSQWLTGEHAGLIDAEIVAALSREITSATLPAERLEFLRLIEKTLQL
jgi:hypothetical protein